MDEAAKTLNPYIGPAVAVYGLTTTFGMADGVGSGRALATAQAYRDVGFITAIRTFLGETGLQIGTAITTAFGAQQITAPSQSQVVKGPSGPGQFVIENYQPPETTRANDSKLARQFLRGQPVDVFRAVTPDRADANIAAGTFLDAVNLNNTTSRHGKGVYASFSPQTAQQEFLAHQAGKDMNIVRGQLSPAPTLTLAPSVAQSGGVNVKDTTGESIIPQPKLQLQETNP